MSRVLIRSGKDPFTPVTAEATLAQDVFNSNTGNYLFMHSVHRALMTPGTELVSNGTLSETRPAKVADQARVNAEFDSFVIPLANAFRPAFAKRLENLTSLIEGLDIPVTVIGVGAQVDQLDRSTGELDGIAATVKRFVGAVLDRSGSIGVRGEFTRDYLRGLGFSDSGIDVIGCPSLFIHGPDYRLPQPPAPLGPDSKIAFNLTPHVPGIGEITARHAAAYRNLVYVGQDADDLRLMLWAQSAPDVGDPRVPVHPAHPLYRQDRIRFFLDIWTWFDFLADHDFAFGTRFHGNVAALLAGTPAVLLAHDSRTLELAEHHRLPHRRITPAEQELDAADLREVYDAKPFDDAYPRLFENYLGFLERNNLEHIYQPDRANPEFDRRLSATEFPPPVRTLCAPAEIEIASRLRWLRDEQLLRGTPEEHTYEAPFPHPRRRDPSTSHRRSHSRTDSRMNELGEQLAASQRHLQRSQREVERQKELLNRQRATLKQQSRRLDALEKRLAAQEERSPRRVVRRLLNRLGRRRSR